MCNDVGVLGFYVEYVLGLVERVIGENYWRNFLIFREMVLGYEVMLIFK